MSADRQAGHDAREPTAAILAEAAAWIANLHDEERGERLEAGFRRWLAADPRHRIAFERANDLWTDPECWPRDGRSSRPARHSRWLRSASMLAAAACVGAALVLGALLYLRHSQVETKIGEQRSLTLEDGTRVYLNTDTRLNIEYDRQARQVRVESGEALFEVARRTAWPFVVLAGERRITALGTTFIVRRDHRQVSVMLVDGKVQVATLGQSVRREVEGVASTVLEPGERLVLNEHGGVERDRPVIASATAWQRGQVVFDRTPLARAASEMNRYNPVKLEVEGPLAAGLLVTGVFRAGDSESLAQAMAESYRLQLVSEPLRIVLRERPDTLR